MVVRNRSTDEAEVWVWARDVVGRNDLRYQSHLRDCPIEYFATYFQIQVPDDKILAPETRSVSQEDTLSFGRQNIQLKWKKRGLF